MRHISRKIIAMSMGIMMAGSAVCHISVQTSIVAEAHSGRTDASGGHRDNKNKSGLGSYHYHCGGHPAHLHTGGVCPYAAASSGSTQTTTSEADTELTKQVQQALNLAQAHLSDEQSQILARTVQFEEKIDENKESKKMVQTFAAIGLGFLLYMILITYASVTAQDVASEKGTKIMEVIFSSIKATDYFYARMIGIFAVILSHLGIYVLGGLAAFLFADSIPLVSQVLKSNPAIHKYI